MSGLHHLVSAICISAFAISPIVLHGQDDSKMQNGAKFQTMPVTTTQIGGNEAIGGTVVPFKEVTLNAQIPGRVVFPTWSGSQIQVWSARPIFTRKA